MNAGPMRPTMRRNLLRWGPVGAAAGTASVAWVREAVGGADGRGGGTLAAA
jgi:hypothetical protein